MLASATVMAPAAQGAPVGAGFELDDSDLRFILKQIQIAEFHGTSNNGTLGNVIPPTSVLGNGPLDLPSHLLPWGLRETSGRNNNLLPGRAGWGAADELFPDMSGTRTWRNTESPSPFGPVVTNYQDRGGNVQDSEPRIISNLIVDQSVNNPAAVDAAGPGAEPDPASGSFFIPNSTPDGGLSSPYNSLFTLFGQFFDHGLDLVGKSGTESVVVPLQPDDPLYQQGSPTNFMVVSRTVLNGGGQATNTTTPYVDQNQTYTSHPSHQVFLREYAMVAGEPVATGHLADGAIAGNIANWTETKANAASMLGIELVDTDVLNVPLLLTDEYGRFLPGPNGFPQLVHRPVAPSRATRRRRSQPLTLSAPTTRSSMTSPTTRCRPSLDMTLGSSGLTSSRATAVATRTSASRRSTPSSTPSTTGVADDIDAMLTATPDAALRNAFRSAAGWGYGERLFQAAKFVTEMEYQHLVFEEFGRKVQPAIRVFAAYDETLQRLHRQRVRARRLPLRPLDAHRVGRSRQRERHAQ